MPKTKKPTGPKAHQMSYDSFVRTAQLIAWANQQGGCVPINHLLAHIATAQVTVQYAKPTVKRVCIACNATLLADLEPEELTNRPVPNAPVYVLNCNKCNQKNK